jgi:copper(I)-binding protein
MKYLILAASALALAGCGYAESPAPTHEPLTATTTPDRLDGGVVVSSIYVQPPFPGRDIAAGFFSLTNNGEDDRLVSVSSPISENVEIHNHIEEDGVMKMRRIDGVDLPSGETVNFKPGSYHIMMFGANIPENAEEVSVTLTYENAAPATMTVPIGEPDEDREMSDKMDHGSGH